MNSLLPNGEQTFLDNNGLPLAAGFVYNYVPGTSTVKTTYQNAAGSIANTNPVILDAAGRAVIYGNGSYRQVLTDSLGNQIWDQVTTGSPLSSIVGAPGIAITPFAQGGQTIYTGSNVTATSALGTTGEFATAATMLNTTGAGASVPASGNKVAGYFATETTASGGNGWSLNTLLLLDAGAAAIGGQQGYELDIANNSGTDFGDSPGFASDEQPAVFGMQITGISQNRVTAAVAIFGSMTTGITQPMWNSGIIAGPYTIAQQFIADYSNSQSSYLIQGSHTFGLDYQGQVSTPAVFSGAAIRFGAQHKVAWRSQDNTHDITMIQGSGTNDLLLGGTGVLSVTVATSFAHTGVGVGFYGTAPIVKQTVTGSKGGNAALASALTALAALGLITDSST